jgi:hypothetical protein
VPILEATTSIATEEGIQLEELAEAAGIAAGERPREDSQAIGVGILAVGEGSLSCPEEELRTVVADSELVRTAGVGVDRSRARVAFRKVAEEVSRRVLGVAFHIAAGVACRSPGAAFRNLGAEAAGRTCPSSNPSSRLAAEGNS